MKSTRRLGYRANQIAERLEKMLKVPQFEELPVENQKDLHKALDQFKVFRDNLPPFTGLKLRVLSPDGFDIERDVIYTSEPQARRAIEAFASRFEAQGYYSGVAGRIALVDIPDACKIVPFKK